MPGCGRAPAAIALALLTIRGVLWNFPGLIAASEHRVIGCRVGTMVPNVPEIPLVRIRPVDNEEELARVSLCVPM